MIDYLDKALVISVRDYKDNDKLCRVLTLEHGKIDVKMTGVKKPAAKLKFAAQPFAFYSARFISGRGGYPTVTDVVSGESFYDICADVKLFAAASIAMQAADVVTEREEPDGELFIESLKCLRSVLYDGDPYYSAAVYILYLLKNCGFFRGYNGNVREPKTVVDLLAAAQTYGYTKSEYGDLSRRGLKYAVSELCLNADVKIPAVKSADVYK